MSKIDKEQFKNNTVLSGEKPFLVFSVNDDTGKQHPVGALWCKGGVFSFTGSVDVSAKAFIEQVSPGLVALVNEEIKKCNTQSTQ